MKDNIKIFESLLNNQIEKILNTETIIFCGAGISKNSSLPLANELIKEVLKYLPSFSNSEKYTNDFINSKIPFEFFVHLLKKIVTLHEYMTFLKVENQI